MSNLRGTLAAGEAVGGNYEILGVAGSGGMGVVYRALDRKLHRVVALKFLPLELSSSPRDRERFLREARTASSLDHPNIGVIHAIEETSEDQIFIVMAYYDGQSLAGRIREGPCTEPDAVDIAIQMARALGEAHAHHIIHRDIKPSNVMLTAAGTARIVDFGLAQITTQQTATSSGTTGTINYMSPEQALEKGADHRTDIWSLGVTLAEMLTGRNPFEREGISATLLAILNEPPKPMPGISPDLQAIVYRALSKDVTTRYQTMAELLADLESVRPHLIAASSPQDQTVPLQAALSKTRGAATAQLRRAMQEASQSAIPEQQAARVQRSRLLIAAYVLAGLLVAALALLFITPARERLVGIFLSGRQKHIVVLPFENESGNANDAVLVAGLIDSLSDRLANLDAGSQSLWVVPGSEVRRLKIEDPEQALQKFGATLAVRGTVNKQGQNIQLTVELIDTKNLRQIGSAELEDANGNIGSLENQAVTRLARLLNLKVPEAAVQQASTSSAPGAYESYLTALGYLQRYDKPGNVDLAITSLRKSIAIDPRFAVSYAQLGEALRLKSALTKDPQWSGQAEQYCRQALQLNPDLPAAYVTLGYLHTKQQPELALQEFQHALSLDEHSAQAESGMGLVYDKLGRLPEAEAALQKAVALRPGSWAGLDDLANFYDQHGRYKEAIHELQSAEQLTPDNTQVLINLAAAYVDGGDPAQAPLAEELLKKSLQISPSYAAYANLANIYSQEGRHAEAAAANERALAIDDQDYLVWFNLLNQYEWMQEPDKVKVAREKAIALLERAAKSAPRDATPQALLADMYAGRQNKEKALEHIQTTLALTPDDPQNLASIADAYENLGDHEQALAYILKALRKGLPKEQLKSDPEVRNLLPRLRQ
jgi:serine/threonine-protein kinase